MKKEDAYETLRLRIVTNRVTPGEILNEKDLMAALEIGRSPLREALFRLQEENLVKPMPRLGYLVTTLDLSEMRELIELRRELEGFAGQLAAERISRKGYDAWQAEGGLTLRQRARAKLLKILETHQPEPLPPEVLKEMDDLLERVDRACDAC